MLNKTQKKIIVSICCLSLAAFLIVAPLFIGASAAISPALACYSIIGPCGTAPQVHSVSSQQQASGPSTTASQYATYDIKARNGTGPVQSFTVKENLSSSTQQGFLALALKMTGGSLNTRLRFQSLVSSTVDVLPYLPPMVPNETVAQEAGNVSLTATWKLSPTHPTIHFGGHSYTGTEYNLIMTVEDSQHNFLDSATATAIIFPSRLVYSVVVSETMNSITVSAKLHATDLGLTDPTAGVQIAASGYAATALVGAGAVAVGFPLNMSGKRKRRKQ